MGVAMNHKAKDKKYIEAGGLLLLLLLGIVGLPKNSQAQENRSNYWFEGGVGITIAGAGPETDSGGGIAARLAAHYQIQRVVISMPLMATIGGESDFSPYLRDSFNSISLLGGYAVDKSKDMDVVFSGGISRIWGSRVVRVRDEECFVFCFDGKGESFDLVWGVPLELGFYTKGGRMIGVAFTIHANINPEEFFGGLTLNLMLGKRDL